MAGTTQEALRQLLVSGYDEFKRILKRRLGSEDFASEVLHETYLRLGRVNTPEPVLSPKAYLLRIALNVAADRSRVNSRRLSGPEIEVLRHFADHALDPATVAEARLDMEALQRALEELPERRRAILLASRLGETPHADIAARFGISIRMVEKELKRALEHCGERLDRKVVQRFGPKPGEQSRM